MIKNPFRFSFSFAVLKIQQMQKKNRIEKNFKRYKVNELKNEKEK